MSLKGLGPRGLGFRKPLAQLHSLSMAWISLRMVLVQITFAMHPRGLSSGKLSFSTQMALLDKFARPCVRHNLRISPKTQGLPAMRVFQPYSHSPRTIKTTHKGQPWKGPLQFEDPTGTSLCVSPSFVLIHPFPFR